MEQNVRPDFYEGQYLGADDLDAAVDYARIQQARHTLGAHTWGIGAGLELRERKLPSGDVDVSVLPGIAWDGFGRAIVVLAPARISPDKLANFQADTPPEGLLVRVWIRYAQTPSRPPAPGFEVCRPDGQFARTVETFAIEVGDMTSEPIHGSIVVAGQSMDARKVRSTFLPGASDLFDESVGYQAFPDGGNRPIWLVPLGFVRWVKQAGQPGRLIARNDSGAGGQPPDSDLIRAVRQYIGVVAESIGAADGLIRLRDRGKDPAPSVSHVRLPRIATDPAKPPENDLVWVEGNLHVLGDARVSGGKLEWRDSATGTDGVPLAIRRVEPNALGGKDLQVIVGADDTPNGLHMFAVGRGKLDAATGQLKPDLTKHFVVRDDGTIGVGLEAPPQLLTLAGEGNTRLEIARVTASLPWSTNAPTNPGGFVINQQSQGSTNPNADFGLMRDRKLRVVLGNQNTVISSQGGDVVISVNYAEPGDTEVVRVTSSAKVGVGTNAPAAKVQIAGDLALDQMGQGAPRPLPAGGTLIWNDGTWLRLNQNLDFSKPIFAVHTPGLFASGSLNVGGAGGWIDPGFGNMRVAGTTRLDGQTTINASAVVNGATVINGATQVNGATVINGAGQVTGAFSTGGSVSIATNLTVGNDLSVVGTKNFVIPHPVFPESKRLVHASIEGPEAAVLYRGEARLVDGRAEIALPSYFEALTRPGGRTVLLTPTFDGDEPISALAASRVERGRFSVRIITPDNPSQRFCWEVKAVRADRPPLAVEVDAPGSNQVVAAAATLTRG